MGASVSVSHAEEALGHHVEVEIHEKVIDVGCGQVGAVKLGAQEAIFLGTPPGEADLVLRSILCHGEEEFQKQASA